MTKEQHSNIKTNVRVQNIYYQPNEDLMQLGMYPATSDKRITLDEARDILRKNNIKFKQLLRVKSEEMILDIPVNEFKKYTIKIGN